MASVNSMPPISETISLLAVKRPRSFAPTKLMSHLYLTGVVRLRIRYAPRIMTTNSAVLTDCPSGTKGMIYSVENISSLTSARMSIRLFTELSFLTIMLEKSCATHAKEINEETTPVSASDTPTCLSMAARNAPVTSRDTMYSRRASTIYERRVRALFRFMRMSSLRPLF